MKTKPFEKLEVGKTYLNRSGAVVRIDGSQAMESPHTSDGYPFTGECDVQPFREEYTSDGYYHLDHTTGSRWDLVSEVVPDDVIEPGEYLTNNGLTAVVLATNAPDKEYPIIGYVVLNASRAEEIHWTAKGEWIAGKKSPRDLVLAQPAAPSLRDAAEALLASYEDLYKKLHDYLASPDKEPVVQNFKAALAADTSNTPQS